ncbi:hypothetical protein [Aureibacillus halotolerans]|uniref:Uncharacterized protein n=1 Tax=Aureibacillus halotolerans TaxID=1508390 RepID=A0A4R6TQN8_9BACI|nr:hypothetical protein [Aureibacillus halotolerans]TDQ32169.1 hypothetical protein EV213_13215 [Aureibacillus halotolerans]
MAIYMSISIIAIVIVLPLATYLSWNQSIKRKCIVWGLTFMVVLTPCGSWLAAMSAAHYIGDGFAGVAVLAVLLPSFFGIGLLFFLYGVLKKTYRPH